jgi:hypothetical protein
MSKIKELMTSYGNLPTGWHFGEGVPAPPQVIDKALEIYNLCDKYYCYLAFPGIDGGIVLSLQNGQDFYDFEINNDLTIDFNHEKGMGFKYDIVEYSKNLSLEEIKLKIRSINKC